MYIGSLQNADRVYNMHPGFKTLFEFVANHDFNAIPLGRVEIDGDNVYAVNVDTTGTPRENQPLEMHRRYIDVHIALEDGETIGWKPIESIQTYTQPYMEQGDCALSPDEADIYFPVRKGQFVIVYPEDPHAPAIGSGKIRKIIGKVLI